MSRNGTQARRFHDATNHSLQSVRSNQHRLIWENLPRPFKLYRSAETVALGDLASDSPMYPLDALSLPPGPASGSLTTPLLNSLLHFSAGITRTLNIGGGVHQFRAAACTGALYHVDVYLVNGPVGNVESGVYQFGPQDGQLHRIRPGDFRSALIEACGNHPAARRSEAMLVLTTTFWRNSWKYQARAYRRGFWDSGTMLANTLAVARAHDLSATVLLGFNDDSVNRLLDLDTDREVAIAVVGIGASTAPLPTSPGVRQVPLETVPYSAYEVPEPLIVETHQASSFRTSEEVTTWRGKLAGLHRPDQAGEAVSLPPSEAIAESIEAVIHRRGSARRFQRTPIALDDLDAILYASTRGIPSDALGASTRVTSELFLIVNAVTGLEPGAYAYAPGPHTLETLRPGDFRAEAGYLDLGQELGADAAVNVYALADLDHILSRLGDRGYRVAQLEASIVSGKIYLASYALNLAATGLTFFDDDVVRFFGPRAAGKDVMFLTALGNHAPRIRTF